MEFSAEPSTLRKRRMKVAFILTQPLCLAQSLLSRDSSGSCCLWIQVQLRGRRLNSERKATERISSAGCGLIHLSVQDVKWGGLLLGFTAPT